ncbi:MAG: hypothetical protein EOM23_07940, partial [Candidatus Moranbacteria bacterium]|nr:hypothetical protein [Candidatus Moranbacteria bacterium]
MKNKIMFMLGMVIFFGGVNLFAQLSFDEIDMALKIAYYYENRGMYYKQQEILQKLKDNGKISVQDRLKAANETFAKEIAVFNEANNLSAEKCLEKMERLRIKGLGLGLSENFYLLRAVKLGNIVALRILGEELINDSRDLSGAYANIEKFKMGVGCLQLAGQKGDAMSYRILAGVCNNIGAGKERIE